MSCTALTLMLIHFLQGAVDPPILPNLHTRVPELFVSADPDFGQCLDLRELLWPGGYQSSNDLTLYELLVGFCEYYSAFNYRATGISIAQGSVCERPEHSEVLFFIEDPFDRRQPVLPTIHDEVHLSRMIRVFSEHAAIAMRPEECTQPVIINRKTESIVDITPRRSEPERGRMNKVRLRPNDPAQQERRHPEVVQQPAASERASTTIPWWFSWQRLLIWSILIASAEFFIYTYSRGDTEHHRLPTHLPPPASDPLPERFYGKFVLERSMTIIHLEEWRSQHWGFFPEEVEFARSATHRERFLLRKQGTVWIEEDTDRQLDQEYYTKKGMIFHQFRKTRFRLRYSLVDGTLYEHIFMEYSRTVFATYSYTFAGEHLAITIRIPNEKAQERNYRRI